MPSGAVEDKGVVLNKCLGIAVARPRLSPSAFKDKHPVIFSTRISEVPLNALALALILFHF